MQVRTCTDSGHSRVGDHGSGLDIVTGTVSGITGKMLIETGYSAAVVNTDEIAAGAMLRLQKEGKRIPEDVLITGLGDSDLAKVADHGICTIRFEYRQSGEKAARLLLGQLENQERSLKTEQIMLDYRLICPAEAAR